MASLAGMIFIVVGDNGLPVTHGIIAQQITAEKYLCQFQAQPVSSRVVDIEELQGYNLFHNDEQRDAFLTVLKRAHDKDNSKKPSKKKVAKKAKKKAIK